MPSFEENMPARPKNVATRCWKLSYVRTVIRQSSRQRLHVLLIGPIEGILVDSFKMHYPNNLPRSRVVL